MMLSRARAVLAVGRFTVAGCRLRPQLTTSSAPTSPHRSTRLFATATKLKEPVQEVEQTQETQEPPKDRQTSTHPAVAQSKEQTRSDKQIEPHMFDGKDHAEFLVNQAPNRLETWAPSQRPRSDAMIGPRFDGKDLESQPRPYAAIELISNEPIKFVHHVAVCDGNFHGRFAGVQGHPKLYINVDKPGVHACQYCGNRFADDHYKEAIEAGKISSEPVKIW